MHSEHLRKLVSGMNDSHRTVISADVDLSYLKPPGLPVRLSDITTQVRFIRCCQHARPTLMPVHPELSAPRWASQHLSDHVKAKSQ